jgi:hypothetical protein
LSFGFDELQNLHESKKGESINLHQYYDVFRIYLEVLKDKPEECAAVFAELRRCLEADRQRLME